MGTFSRCILISDYDSTLTGYDGIIPQANLEAVEYFTANGGIFTVATGRSLPSARMRLESVPVNGPVLVYNGAVCCKKDGSEVVFCHPLPQGSHELIRRCITQWPQLTAEVQGLQFHWSRRNSPRRNAWLTGEGAAIVHGDWDTLPDPAVNVVLYSGTDDPFLNPWESADSRLLEALSKEIGSLPGYDAVHSAPGMLEIGAAGVNKGSSARALAELLERPVLICAGDAPNDLSMLEAADLAFVPEGSHPMMERSGFRKAAPCGEGAIADVIAQLELLL